MPTYLQMILTIVCSILGAGGFWSFLQNRHDKKDAKTRMILGLGHDRLLYLMTKYIERGWVSSDEYEDLIKYLYNPYREMGGNGTIKRLMEEVDKLPVRRMTYIQQIEEHKKEEGLHESKLES